LSRGARIPMTMSVSLWLAVFGAAFAFIAAIVVGAF
jgi:hypothetical protein